MASGNRWEIRTTKPCVLLNPGALLWHHKSWSRSLLRPRAGTGSRQKRRACTCRRGVTPGPRPAVSLTVITNKTQTTQTRCRRAGGTWQYGSDFVITTCLSALLPSPLDSGETEAKRRRMTCPGQSLSLPTSTLRVAARPTLSPSFHFCVWKAEWHFDGKRPAHDNSLDSDHPFPKSCLEWHFYCLFFQISIQLDIFHWTGGHLDVHHAAPRWPYNDRPPLLAPRGQDPASHKLPTLLRRGQPPLSDPHRAGSPGPHTPHARLPDSGCSKQRGGRLQGGLYRVRSRRSWAVAQSPMTLLWLRTRHTIPNKHVPRNKMYRQFLDIYS